MRIPTEDHLGGLVGWRPPGGVVSVYVDLHPDDRAEPWRIEVRNGLGAAGKAADSLERAYAVTAARIEQHVGEASGRTRIGFVEVAQKPGREEWFSVQAPLPQTEIAYASTPVIAPLAAIIDRGEPRGIAAVSAERVRLMGHSLAGLEELEVWGLEIFSLDWRERKAQRSSDPARVQGTNASGRDQFEQRLEANRERFLHEAGRLAASELRRRGAPELLCFGDSEHVRALAEGARPELAVRALDASNLISAPLGEIARRVEEHLDVREREREMELVERAKGEAGRARAALGPDETGRALDEGRVEHLVLDPRTDGAEHLVEEALATSARVTQLHEETASDALADADGVVALLRY